jgi:hypothetical protein
MDGSLGKSPTPLNDYIAVERHLATDFDNEIRRIAEAVGFDLEAWGLVKAAGYELAHGCYLTGFQLKPPPPRAYRRLRASK